MNKYIRVFSIETDEEDREYIQVYYVWSDDFVKIERKYGEIENLMRTIREAITTVAEQRKTGIIEVNDEDVFAPSGEYIIIEK